MRLRVLCSIAVSVTCLLLIYVYTSHDGVSTWTDENDIMDVEDNSTLPRTVWERPFQQEVQIGEISPNCGLAVMCPSHTFPVHIYTGQDHTDQPKLCVGGKYLIGRDINGGGRGINMVVLEPTRQLVIQVKRFDTYNESSENMDNFIELYVKEGDIIILLTFDEASQHLQASTKKLLFDLGSAQIQDLKFRGHWYMVSQKGISGFTPYEKLRFSKDNKWTQPFNDRFCVPTKIFGQMIHPDPLARENKARVEFCQKYHTFGNFCRSELINEPIYPAALTNRSLLGNLIFATPIVVLAGRCHESLVMTLDSLIHQPGIQPQVVLVIYTPNFPEAGPLAGLFGFHSQLVEQESYWEQMEASFEVTDALFPEKKSLIIIEEGLLLSPDFLFFMAQTGDLIFKDETIMAVSAWNENGFEGVSSNQHLGYRVESFPGLGFHISKDLYHREMKGRMRKCCKHRSWLGWLSEERFDREIVVPDLSRVIRRPSEPFTEMNPETKHLFFRKRLVNLDATSWIDSPHKLTRVEYEKSLNDFFHNTVSPLELTESEVKGCEEKGSPHVLSLVGGKEKAFVVFFSQSSGQDWRLLQQLLRCFGLPTSVGVPPRGLHRGMVRFTVNGSDVFLVGSSSPYFRYHPSNSTLLSLSSIK